MHDDAERAAMRILVITGGRINGNTQKTVESLRAQMDALAKADGVTLAYETVSLMAEGFMFCRGCRICFEKGEALCPCRDGLAALREKLLLAAGVIVASPVYVEDVSGTMKNWIDRMSYHCYRPAFAGKLAFVVTTSGVGTTGRAAQTMATALRLWGFGLGGRRNYRTGARITADDIRKRHGKTLAGDARRFYRGLKNGTALKPSIYSLIAFTVQQYSWRWRGEVSDITRQYWQQQGWLDKGRRFYIPHRRSFIVSRLTRAAGLVFARFFL